ncbi:3-beta hydroxysteroid dehydrogenase/isomerase family-domain-containing protein [Entophlyctis helioformis]|nr:3-beta hydroxysteroid dehydrogenase/isomerase family-domain-containing protein [Entophlyctis helioformis]
MRLGLAVVRDMDMQVRLLDIRFPVQLPAAVQKAVDKGSIVCQKMDLLDNDSLAELMSGASVVFHAASFGMSGAEMMDSARTKAVNIGGTRSLVDACLKAGVPYIVYTSSSNVVFGGQTIVDGDETMPHFPPHLHRDEYSRTKSIAEEIVLSANGSALLDGAKEAGTDGRLWTCAIRSAAIYGDGEERHFPRTIQNIKDGYARIRIGPPTSMQDWVYVDNLADGHVLAAKSLMDTTERAAAGEAYFISDNDPINTIDFMEPLFTACGQQVPTFHLSVAVMLWIAFLIEYLHPYLSHFVPSMPLLTRTEVLKVGVTHFFSIAKAQRDLGYHPRVHRTEGMRRTMRHLAKMGLVGRIDSAYDSGRGSVPSAGQTVQAKVRAAVKARSAAQHHAKQESKKRDRRNRTTKSWVLFASAAVPLVFVLALSAMSMSSRPSADK